MKRSILPITILSIALLAGLITLNHVATAAIDDTKSKVEKVTTASGVEIDPSRHRIITYQMW